MLNKMLKKKIPTRLIGRLEFEDDSYMLYVYQYKGKRFFLIEIPSRAQMITVDDPESYAHSTTHNMMIHWASMGLALEYQTV